MAVLPFPKNGLGRGGDLGGTRSVREREGVEQTLEIVKIDLDEDEIRRLIDAVDHYEAYLHSQQRDDMKFRDLLVRLRKMLAKRA